LNLGPGPSEAQIRAPGLTAIVGATGGIGGALVTACGARGDEVVQLGRGGSPPLDLEDESTIERAAAAVEALGRPLRRLIIATGVLALPGARPERALGELDPVYLARLFAVNAIGPALVLKHFQRLLPRDAPTHVAVLSARVGSIGDNRLGGWHAYRASKAALNQLVRTISVELARTRPLCTCVLLHPGTVDTGLSRGFRKAGLQVQTPEEAAARLLDVLDDLTPAHTGRFFDQHGIEVSW
jgi:NAD(P)-dependent dehydrogenase (short-subunit alcohol dehydrogenase family)